MRNSRFIMSPWRLYMLLGVLFGPSKVVGESAAVPVSVTTNTSTLTLQVLQVHLMKVFYTICTSTYRYLH